MPQQLANLLLYRLCTAQECYLYYRYAYNSCSQPDPKLQDSTGGGWLRKIAQIINQHQFIKETFSAKESKFR